MAHTGFASVTLAKLLFDRFGKVENRRGFSVEGKSTDSRERSRKAISDYDEEAVAMCQG